jgi:AcrR family transcriptional regulator
VTFPKLTPRKAPRQPRARATVDAIIEAAEQLTRKLGVEAWTTNHVAERAGVSIGTLYQYFPSKESLLTALYLQRREARLAAVATALAELGGGRAVKPAAARAVARAWLDGDWPLELTLRAQVVAIGAARKLVDVDDQALRLVRQVVARSGVDDAVAARRGFVVLRAIEGAIAAAVREQPAWLDDEVLIGDIAALVSALRET